MTSTHNKIEERLIFDKVQGEHRFKMDPSQLDTDIDYINSESIGVLSYYPYENEASYNLNWLKRISHKVNKIYITTPEKGKFSFEGLAFARELSSLYINNSRAFRIDLGFTPKLKSLYCNNCSKLENLDKLIYLEKLIATKLNVKYFSSETFEKLIGLRVLSLSNVDLSDGFNFIGKNKIQELLLFTIRNLNLKGLRGHNIELFQVEKCKNISGLEDVLNNGSIRTAKFVDSIEFESVKQFEKMDSLESLVVVGTSLFRDGDIAELESKLKYFGFDNRRHYNIRYQL